MIIKLILKFVGLAALGLMSVAQVGANEWNKDVRVATEGAYPPFNFYDTNNNLVGFDIEITEALCAKIKVKCTIVARTGMESFRGFWPTSTIRSSPLCRSPRNARRRLPSPRSTMHHRRVSLPPNR